MTHTDVRGSRFEHISDAAPWRTILLVAAGISLVITVLQWTIAAGSGLSIRPVGFAVIAAAVVAGNPARWGSAAALLLTGLFAMGWSSGVAWAVAAFVAAAVSTRLWAHREEEPEEGWGAWTLRYAVVAVGGVLVFAATSSWLLDLFGRMAFSISVKRTVVTNLPLALAGAPLVRLAVEYTGAGGQRITSSRPSAKTRTAVVLVALCWTVGGYVGSFLFRIVERVPPGSLERRFSTVVSEFVGLWGWQGTYAQFLLGLVALATIGVLLRR